MSIGFLSRLRGWRLAEWIFVFFVVSILGWFCYSIIHYYLAIRSGVSNPLLDQRLQSSIASQIANHKVTPEDLVRLQPPSAPAFGNPEAKLVVVEFIDFSCPYSLDSFSAVREIMQRYQDRIYFIARDFPVDEIHPRATSAALAARCAHEQGRYWPYHDKLFTNQTRHEDADLLRYAEELDLNTESFEVCLTDRRYADRLQTELADGLRAGVEGTPTFFFNGIKVQGALNVQTLEFIIKTFLKQPNASSL